MADCDHLCCEDRNLPFHDHFLNAENCPRCASIRIDREADAEPTQRAGFVDPGGE